MSPSLSLSVCCVTYAPKQDELLRMLSTLIQSIKSCIHHLGEIEVDLYVVDNGPAQGDADVAARVADIAKNNPVFKDVQLITGQGNVGFAAAHNISIRDSQADYHLVLNPDVFVGSEALEVGIEYLRANSNVALVAPFATDGDGATHYIAKRFPSLFSLFLRAFAPRSMQRLFEKSLFRYELRDLIPAEKPLQIQLASGCFMLVKTKILQQLEGFDESYFMYFEDFDLSLRIGEKYQLMHLPQMKIVHLGGEASKKGLKHIHYFISSGFKFFNKHGWKFF